MGEKRHRDQGTKVDLDHRGSGIIQTHTSGRAIERAQRARALHTPRTKWRKKKGGERERARVRGRKRGEREKKKGSFPQSRSKEKREREKEETGPECAIKHLSNFLPLFTVCTTSINSTYTYSTAFILFLFLLFFYTIHTVPSTYSSSLPRSLPVCVSVYTTIVVYKCRYIVLRRSFHG